MGGWCISAARPLSTEIAEGAEDRGGAEKGTRLELSARGALGELHTGRALEARVLRGTAPAPGVLPMQAVLEAREQFPLFLFCSLRLVA